MAGLSCALTLSPGTTLSKVSPQVCCGAQGGASLWS